MIKTSRFFLAISIAFGSLFYAAPAQATCVNTQQSQTIAAALSTDASETTTVTTLETCGGDDTSYQVPLTTTVSFDGQTFSSVYATTNSVITFGNPDGTYWDYPQTPSISLYSMDWVVYPSARADEHLTIQTSDGGFQIDISARPIWLQNTPDVTNIVITAAINTDGTVAISYAIDGPTYDGQTRTGVRLTDGSVVTLEQYGIAQVEEAPVLQPTPVEPTPEPTVEPTPEPTPTVTPEPTPEPTITPEPTPEPTTTPTPEPTPTPVEPTPEPVIPVIPPVVDPPVIEPQPQPQPIPFPVEPPVEPTPEPTPSPTPSTDSTDAPTEPTPAPTVEPTPEPTPTVEPTPDPTPTVDPTPEPTPTPEPVVHVLNAPTNVRVQQLSGGNVEILWDAPAQSNTAVERYAISWSNSNGGWGVASTETNVYLSQELFRITGGLDSSYTFTVRSDNDTLGVYSAQSEAVSITVASPPPVHPVPVFPDTYMYTTVDEGGQLTLVAPAGYRIDSVVFASYGTPISYAVDGCHASDSASIVQSHINGDTLSINADNGVFGDPCGGTYKRLSVVVSTSPIPESIPAEPTPAPTTTPEPVVTPQPTPEPTTEPTPTPQPTVEPTPTPQPEIPVIPPVVEPPVIEPQPQPQPIPFPVEPPVVIPDPEPTVEPTPEPTPTEIPVIIEPTPIPTEEPVVEPTPEPTVDPSPTPTPIEEPTPSPTPSEEPTPEPTENVVEPLPEPEPSTTPAPTPEPELPVNEAAAVQAISNLVEIAPENLTDKQVDQLVAAANVVFETAEQGSPAYQEALEALAVVAEADDAELPEELAAIPLLGDVAGAALELFNDLGNIGADMSPAQREKAEETVVAAVVVGQVAQVAAGAAMASASSAAAGASTGGSSGRRVK